MAFVIAESALMEQKLYSMSKSIVSALKIEEESASFILPFVQDVYPYFYERYYLTPNHMPMEMLKDILRQLTAAKEIILYDTFNPALIPYIEKFDLFVLEESFKNGFWDDSKRDKIKKQPQQFLYEHRYKVAHLYDMFIEWAEVQLQCHGSCGDEHMFNIEGP